MGGDPDPSTSVEVAEAVVKGGADILELGIPFSDPIADGRSVQSAAVRALASKTKPDDVLQVASEVRKFRGVPVVLMTYFNPIFSRGVSEFLHAASRSGVDGVIVPDLPLEDAHRFGRAAREKGVDSILLAAPTTPEERMKAIIAGTSGFLYLVSVLGVTGAREELKESTVRLVTSARRFTEGKVPLAVGFGISKPEHVKAVIQAGANAAIVGSAIVDRVVKVQDDRSDALRDIEHFVRSLKEATKSD